MTTRPTVGTNVLVLPQRNALQLAKTVATLDRVSTGRMILGVGWGWNQDARCLRKSTVEVLWTDPQLIY
jgi:alkanesulfonate monooxygenase SsuD/methylene tetrahydromethanopterin reductase-like flavin-dependent oxidoreductase (luciferase family)